ncbi:MAG: ABC transporter ATP-binding protein [Candidatus Kapabacteria bacterium]|nr:ABC transporter ATP-binding protein [Candidatus Kapabacteria bacterium]
MPHVLHAEHINKYYHDPVTFQVLKDISLTINKGEFVSIVGKSGCGKSTLLYILSTMDTDYEGTLEINGELITGQQQNYLAHFRNQHIGFIFQFHFLLQEFTVLQNVMIPALKLGVHTPREIEQRAMEKLTLMGIADQANKPAKNLSGGQQQRAAIARALINNPTIIIGDEPTGNLDSENSIIVFDILHELTHTHGQSIIIVTHDSEFANRTDRIIEMHDGHIVSSHSTE